MSTSPSELITMTPKGSKELDELVIHAMAKLILIGKDNSRTWKEDILRVEAWNPVFVLMLEMACNPFTTYGITTSQLQVPKPSEHPHPPSENFADFRSLMGLLSSRHLTGAKAQLAVEAFLDNCTASELMVYTRIIDRDLRLGITAKTINKVIPDLIPIFEVMLAESYKNKKHKIEFPCIVEPKLDGVRCIGLSLPSGIYLKTRNGIDITDNFPKIASLLRQCLQPGYVVDGELIDPRGFNQTMMMLFRKNMATTDSDHFQYWIFDYMSYDEFTTQSFTPYNSRRVARRKWFSGQVSARGFNNTLIHVPGIYVNDHTELQCAFADKVAHGYEGILIKDPSSTYERKRSTSWIKLKPDMMGSGVDVDLKIIKLIEGAGKYIGKVGAIQVVYKGRRVKVGSGLSDYLRKHMMDYPDEYIGHHCTVVAQEETPDGSLRFPRFKCMRPDKD